MFFIPLCKKTIENDVSLILLKLGLKLTLYNNIFTFFIFAFYRNQELNKKKLSHRLIKKMEN